MNPNAVTKKREEFPLFFFVTSYEVMFYTYVLRSVKKGMLYKGSTEDLNRRLLEHNSGMVNYTSKYLPWDLVYWEEFPTRSEAMKREKFFKSGKGRELLKTLVGPIRHLTVSITAEGEKKDTLPS